MASRRGWHCQNTNTCRGLSLGADLVSTNDRLSIFSILFRLFPSGGEKTNCAAFCTVRIDVLQRMLVEIFAQKIEDLTCL